MSVGCEAIWCRMCSCIVSVVQLYGVSRLCSYMVSVGCENTYMVSVVKLYGVGCANV